MNSSYCLWKTQRDSAVVKRGREFRKFHYTRAKTLISHLSTEEFWFGDKNTGAVRALVRESSVFPDGWCYVQFGKQLS